MSDEITPDSDTQQRPPGAGEVGFSSGEYEGLLVDHSDYAALDAYTKRVEAERDAIQERYDEIHYEWENACDRERSALAELGEVKAALIEAARAFAANDTERLRRILTDTHAQTLANRLRIESDAALAREERLRDMLRRARSWLQPPPHTEPRARYDAFHCELEEELNHAG
jgi:hypothetical protein